MTAAAFGGAALLLGGCGEGSAPDVEDEPAAGELAQGPLVHKGRRLFEQETFGGNGRTCVHCHGRKTGTISPEDAQEVFDEDPQHPLFKHDGSDDFQGNGSSRIRQHATILVQRRLPLGVTLLSDPTADKIVVARGVPTTLDTPGLDPVLMLDGRASSLFGQAKGAILGHAQAPSPPGNDDVQAIVDYEKTRRFYSSDETFDYAQTGAAPGLPQGKSPAQKRGRLWFEDAAVAGPLNPATPRKGLCAGCHSGPLLNEANGLMSLPTLGAVPQGSRFQSVLVAELNVIGNEVFDFAFQGPGGPMIVHSPDPGRALVTGNFAPPPDGQLSQFKIPILRGIKKTGPYFHDNSAKTLQDVVNHYAQFFEHVSAQAVDGDPPLQMTAQDKADLVAFLKLL